MTEFLPPAGGLLCAAIGCLPLGAVVTWKVLGRRLDARQRAFVAAKPPLDEEGYSAVDEAMRILEESA